MKRSFDTLIELTQRKSDHAAQRLGVLMAQARDSEYRGETLKAYRDDYRARLEDAIKRGVDATQLRNFQGFLGKLDEAVKLGPALDALIRHKLKVLGVANGQRVPEDWHRLSPQALVHRALRASLNPAYRLDANEGSLILATPSMPEMLQQSARAATTTTAA